MKRKGSSVISILAITLLTACGLAPKPTLSVTDIQNTAFPIVMTQYAQTKAAMPTATPIPPTDTQAPTLEVSTLAPVSLPTIPFGSSVPGQVFNPNASPTPDCSVPPPPKPKGTTVKINLVNKSGGPVSLYLGMFNPNDQGECVEYHFNLRDRETQLVTILSACYWGYGYQTSSKPSTPGTHYICLNDTTQTKGLTIGKDSIGFD
jgi:hypothetical protein